MTYTTQELIAAARNPSALLAIAKELNEKVALANVILGLLDEDADAEKETDNNV
jgi:hypothetical protein